MKKKIKVLIADDHSLVRNGLRLLFEQSPDMSVVAEASSGSEAVELAQRMKPDVAILDISMPVMGGVETARILRKNAPALKILMLTMHESEDYVHQMMQEGANGYILKNAERDELFNAVRTVAAGGQSFSPAISKLMVDGFVKNARGEKPGNSPSTLTKRELEVLQLIAEGHTNRAIAEKLFLSVRTVNSHRTNLMRKLKIHDTATLVRYAIQNGISSVSR